MARYAKVPEQVITCGPGGGDERNISNSPGLFWEGALIGGESQRSIIPLNRTCHRNRLLKCQRERGLLSESPISQVLPLIP